MDELKLSSLISESQLMERIHQLADEIDERFKGEDLVTVCVLKGSIMFYTDLVRNLNLNVTCEFLGVSSYEGGTKSTGEVKLTMDLTNSVKGKNVLIIEDIVDTGLTMNYLKKSIQARGPKTISTATLLLKPDALKEPCELDFVGFEIENEFVVGYGLDYQGFYRNLPYVAKVQNMN